MTMNGHLRRVAWTGVSVLAAACSIALATPVAFELLQIVAPASDAPKTSVFLLLAWPAYVFAKWSVEAWRVGWARAGASGPMA